MLPYFAEDKDLVARAKKVELLRELQIRRQTGQAPWTSDEFLSLIFDIRNMLYPKDLGIRKKI